MASSVPREHRKTNHEIFTLHEMFRVVGDQLSNREVRSLKCLYNSNFSEEMEAKINDGFTFLLALERLGKIDDSNFRYLTRLLRIISRLDLIQFVSLKRRKTVSPDPVDEFLEHTAKSRVIIPFKRKLSDSLEKKSDSSREESNDSRIKDLVCDNESDCETENLSEAVTSTSGSDQLQLDKSGSNEPQPSTSQQNTDGASPVDSNNTDNSSLNSAETLEEREPPPSKRRKAEKKGKSGNLSTSSTATNSSSSSSSETTVKEETLIKDEIKRKVTCDIRLRVRAEYCNHEAALQGNIHSNKPELLERQFERFFQANTILKSRDLGSIICDIKFSELTYLDAFWRDYINGSLLEALKGVFITDSLKQAVGHEAIKLLVNVDEDDYVAGRIKLLQNLKD